MINLFNLEVNLSIWGLKFVIFILSIKILKIKLNKKKKRKKNNVLRRNLNKKKNWYARNISKLWTQFDWSKTFFFVSWILDEI